jgi:hypothetical protein
MNKYDQILNNEKSRVQIGGSNADPKGGNDKPGRPGQSPLPSRPGQSPLPRTDVSGNTGVPLGGDPLGKSKSRTRVTGNDVGANDNSRRGLNLVGARDRKTGPKAPGQTGTNVAGKNTKGQTQTGKPANLDYEIPCPGDATSGSNNFVSVKTKTDNTSADRNTDPSNIQNLKPGQFNNFLKLVGKSPNPNDKKNPKNPNAANQTGAPNANANANPLTNVDAKKPDQGKRPTSTQPKAGKPKPDMRSRISNIRNANKFPRAENSSLSPMANLISEPRSKIPAKTPDRPSKSKTKGLPQPNNQTPLNEKDDRLPLESNHNLLDHTDDGLNFEGSLRIIEKIRDTQTYITPSGPMMDNIKIKRNNTFSLSTHFSPEKPEREKKSADFNRPKETQEQSKGMVRSMNHHLAARELTEEFLDANHKLRCKPLRGMVKTKNFVNDDSKIPLKGSLSAPVKSFVVEETFLHNELKYRKIEGTLRMEDDLYRSQILTEEIS